MCDTLWGKNATSIVIFWINSVKREILSSEDGKIIHFILELSLLYQEKMKTIG